MMLDEGRINHSVPVQRIEVFRIRIGMGDLACSFI